MLLDVCKGLVDLGAELPLNPLAAAQTITMFAAVGAFVFAHQGAGLVSDLAHFGGAVAAHVQDRTHMQGAHRRMGIPRAFGAVAFEHMGQLVGVLG